MVGVRVSRIRVKARFAAWIVAILIAIAAPLWMLLPAETSLIRMVMQGVVASIILLGLMQTTPPDAIRLRWHTSMLLLLLGAAWFAMSMTIVLGPLTLDEGRIGIGDGEDPLEGAECLTDGGDGQA